MDTVKRLSDADLDFISTDVGPWMANVPSGTLKQLIYQSKEASRLRAGLEALADNLRSRTMHDPDGFDWDVALELCIEEIEKLLEDTQ